MLPYGDYNMLHLEHARYVPTNWLVSLEGPKKRWAPITAATETANMALKNLERQAQRWGMGKRVNEAQADDSDATARSPQQVAVAG